MKKISSMNFQDCSKQGKKSVKMSKIPPELDDSPGIYALGFSKGIKYDKGTSRIIYIGSSLNLKKRITQHSQKPHNKTIELAASISGDGLVFSFWPLPEIKKKWLLCLEGEALWAFERKHKSVPIANLDIPEWADSRFWDGLLELQESKCQTKALTLDEFAKKLGLECCREEKMLLWLPAGDFGILMQISIDEDELHCDLNKTFNIVRFKSKEQIEKEKNATNDHKFNHLRYVGIENIAAWPPKKFNEIVEICNSLELIPKKRAKVTKRFEPKDPTIPKPHTWGEIAFIQGRILSDSWKPENKVKIEILHDGEILGEANLNKEYCNAKDVANLPQTEIQRPSYYDQFTKDDEAAEDLVWDRYEDGLPEDPKAQGKIIVESKKNDEIEEYYEQYPEVKQNREKSMFDQAEKLFRDAYD